MHRDPASALNEHQRRHLYFGLVQVDKLLTEVEGILAAARSRTLFPRYRDDLSVAQQKLLEGSIARLRASLPPSPAQAALAGLERVTRERGLAEFRAGLRLLAERLAAPAMEVAVFGRVSCGKSSLLNYLLGAAILPTGATPITAVPTHVGYGTEPLLTAELERQTQRLPLEQLAALASEQHNPDNRLGVTRLTVAYPSPRLRPGVVFVDTPGLGSIRSWGAMETLAYLPRSDMAILLVDAGSALGGDELSLARWLQQGGVPVQVMLSKADLVAPDDLEQGLRFTREALEREGAAAMPVRAVSVRRTELAEAWFEYDLLPLYGQLHERFQTLLERRLAALRDGVVAALSGAVAAAPDAAAVLELEGQLRQAEAEGERVRRLCRQLGDPSDAAVAAVIAGLAGALQAAWQDPAGTGGEAWAMAGGEALGQALVDYGRGAVEGLSRLAETYQATLRQARQALPGLERETEGDAFAAHGLPMPEIGPLPFPLGAPRMAWLGTGHVRSHFRRELEARANLIADALRRHGARLQQRALAIEAGLERQFQAHADIYRAALQRHAGTLRPEAAAGPALRRELVELQRWQPRDAVPASGGGPAA